MKPVIKAMADLEPCEIAVVCDPLETKHNAEVIVRTSSGVYFDVISLTNFKEGECWTSYHEHKNTLTVLSYGKISGIDSLHRIYKVLSHLTEESVIKLYNRIKEGQNDL